MIDKDDIRRRIKARKTLLDDSDRESAAARVFGLLEQTAAFMMADRILMYHSLPDELSTRSFIHKWAGRKHFYLPRVNGLNLEILPYDEQRLALGSFHIEEPTGDDTASVDDMELVVVPAVAYDRRGNRVGRGKGYYDRLLRETRALKVGVGYDFQLMDEDIPAEPHDVRVDVVITETRLLKI
ncbi:MAG: 5-formyltetrahydrofolate cyclo-ligase [Duncaniella sp.]|nr:5-formyltetrahydrofolate cyclo-ligase [Duncaniella sp.]MDE6178452.1 5-formyltetrahydrofolate cyclo-ligase [Duncaniella sp.]